jgi:hypothetical protein
LTHGGAAPTFLLMMRTTTGRGTAPASKASLRFSPINVVLLLLGAVALVAGYVLLAGGSIVAAPLILLLGYVVLIPAGIIK